jgi:hypothetical protein
MFIFAYLKEILFGIVGFFALYLFNRNKTLKAEKEVLEQNITTKDKVIDVQNKVMEATTSVTHSDIGDSIDRLSDTNKK